MLDCSPDNTNNSTTTTTTNNGVNNLEVLKSLGINTKLESRKDPNGNLIPETSNPLGKKISRLSTYKEFFTAGFPSIGNKDYSISDNFAYDKNLISDYAGDTTWTKIPKKATSGDIDGDGYDEILMLLFYKDNKISLQVIDDSSQKFKFLEPKDLITGITVDPSDSSYDDDSDFELRNYYYLFDIVSGNLDDDENDEFIVTYHNTIYIFDNDFKLINSKKLTPFEVYGSWDEKEEQFLRVAIGDVNFNGKNEIVAVYSMDASNIDSDPNARFYIYKDTTFALEKDGDIRYNNDNLNKLFTANVALGDIDGDSKIEIVFAGRTYGDSNCGIIVFKYNETEKDYKYFTRANNEDVISNVSESKTDYYSSRMFSIACADLRGERKDLIIFGNEVIEYGAKTAGGNSVLFEPYGNVALFNDNEHQIYADQIVIGNFDQNQYGKEQIVCLETSKSSSPEKLYKISVGSSGNIERTCLKDKLDTLGTYPIVAAGNVDNDSPILEYTGKHEVGFSTPIILAVLASPPYYSSVDYAGNQSFAATQYGQAKGKEIEKTNSVGFSVGVSFGYEFELSVFGIKFGGVEFNLAIENSFEWAFSKSVSIEKSYGIITPGGEDAVLFSAIPYDIYYYKVISSPFSKDIGKEISINVPREPMILPCELGFYNKNNGDGVDIDSTILSHKIGEPFSYPSQDKLDKLSNLPSGEGKLELYSPKWLGVSAGNQFGSQSIQYTTTSGQSFSYELSVNFEVVTTVGNVKAGVSAGTKYGYQCSTSISESTIFSGSVPNIPSDQYKADLSYSWMLAGYSYKAGEQKFFVVNYLVK